MKTSSSPKPTQQKGKTMRSKLRWLFALVAVVAMALTVSACGDDDSDDGDTSAETEQFAAPTAAPEGAKEGGSLTVIAASDVDYIDPGAAYYQFTYMVTSATQSNLMGYAPGDIDARPLLAAEEPEVSEDGKTITYTIRDDVKYSPPVDRTVVAADVEYAIERSVLPGVP